MRVHLRTAAVVLLAVVMVAWFLRGADLGAVSAAIQDGRVELLALAVGVTCLTYFFRAVRWQYLLRPLGRPPFSDVFRTTVIGFAVSTLVPARAGEVVRPYLLARRSGFSAASAFATIVLERLLDLLTVLVLFGFYLLFFNPVAAEGHASTFRALKSGGLITAAGGIAGLGLMMVLAGHPDTLARWALKVERVVPARVAALVAKLVHTFLQGLAIVRQPGRMAVAGLLSFPLWLSIAAGIWLGARAYAIDMSFPASFLLMALLVVGVAVPTPGSVGGYHKAYQIGAVAFFGVANDRAVAAAVVAHAISIVPVTVAGVIFLAQEGLSLGRLRALAAPGPAEDAP